MISNGTQPNAAGSPAPGGLMFLLSARAVRDFGDGFVAVLLPVYLTMLGFSPFEVGIATAALLTLGIGVIGSRHDRRDRCCQTSSNPSQFPKLRLALCRGEPAPFGESGGTVTRAQPVAPGSAHRRRNRGLQPH
jgi:hypothetical protein